MNTEDFERVDPRSVNIEHGTRFLIVCPSQNVGCAICEINAGLLAIKIDWNHDPTDADREYFERAVSSMVPSCEINAVKVDSRAEADRLVGRFLGSVNN